MNCYWFNTFNLNREYIPFISVRDITITIYNDLNSDLDSPGVWLRDKLSGDVIHGVNSDDTVPPRGTHTFLLVNRRPNLTLAQLKGELIYWLNGIPNRIKKTFDITSDNMIVPASLRE